LQNRSTLLHPLCILEALGLFPNSLRFSSKPDTARTIFSSFLNFWLDLIQWFHFD
jgi:hypothetical protein